MIISNNSVPEHREERSPFSKLPGGPGAPLHLVSAAPFLLTAGASPEPSADASDKKEKDWCLVYIKYNIKQMVVAVEGVKQWKLQKTRKKTRKTTKKAEICIDYSLPFYKAFLDCASIIFGIIWQNRHVFFFFLKRKRYTCRTF